MSTASYTSTVSSSSSSTTSSSYSSTSSSSSSVPFSPCFVLSDTCWSTYSESAGYCCANGLCDPYDDCSFGANSAGNLNNEAAAISTSTLLFVLCVLLFGYLGYRRWRLRRDFMAQLRYLSYLDADDQHARRSAAAGALGVDGAVELADVQSAAAGEADDAAEQGGGPAAAAGATGRGRGSGFKAFTGRAFKLGEYDAVVESTAVRSGDLQRPDADESQHAVDVLLDADEDEKTS